MNYKKEIFVLITLISVFILFATIIGIKAWDTLSHTVSHETVRGDNTLFLTKGIYKHNPKWFVLEGIAWDIVTVFLGLPILVIGLILYIRNSIKGVFLLTGGLVYTGYQYMIYSVGWAFNRFVSNKTLGPCSD